MEDPFGVRRLQRVRHLSRQPHRSVGRERPLQGSPVHVLQHQVVRPDVVDLADMRMVQGGNRARLDLEAGGRRTK